MAAKSSKATPRSGTGAVLELLQSSGNVKIALRQTEKLLQQHPSSALHKALRALALDYADQRAEALMICRDVQKLRPTDSQVLSLVKAVYQRASLFSDITLLYDTAFEDEPRREENGTSLFLALASELKLSQQQQVAHKLLRLFKKPIYALWSVGSVLTQVTAMGTQRSLDLAEVLLSRNPVELGRKKREGANAEVLQHQYSLLLTHLATLRQERKHAQALKLLQTHQDGVPLQDTDRLRLQLVAEGGLAGSCAVARARVLRNIEQWTAIREYIFAAFLKDGHLDVSGSTPLRIPSTTPGASTAVTPTPHQVSPHAFFNSRGGHLSPQSGHEEGSPMGRLPSIASRGSKAGSDYTGLHGEGPPKTPLMDLLDFAGRTAGAASRSADDKKAADAGLDTPGGLEIHHGGGGVQDAYLLFKHLQRTARDHGSRTPFLAELEMRALAFACSELEASERGLLTHEHHGQPGWYSVVSHGDLADFVDCIAVYFGRHGHRGGCYSDIKPYLTLLDETRAAGLLWKMQTVLNEKKDGVDDWAMRCANAQRSLTLWQVRRGVRYMESAAFDTLAADVNELLESWERLHPFVTEDVLSSDTHALRAKCVHGLRDEMHPSPNLDEVLCLAAVHLLDMDRAFCKSRAGAGPDSRMPSMQERFYMLDALTVLELGAKLSPHCNRLRLLLVATYAAAGAAIPARKCYDIAALSEQQDTSLSFLLLDRLMYLGWWDDLPETFQRLSAAQERVAGACRIEIANCYEVQGGRSMHRCGEFARMLGKVEGNIMRGRSVVEEAMLRLMRMPGTEAMASFLKDNAARIEEVASRQTQFWSVKESLTDRVVFSELHFLPTCTPLQAVQLGTIGAPAFLPQQPDASVPPQWYSVFRPRSPEIMVSTLAYAWPLIPPDAESANWASAATKATKVAPPTPAEPSALEEMLAPRREASAACLKLRALLLLILDAMLQSPPAEASLSKHLNDFHATLATEGMALHCDVGLAQQLSSQENSAAVDEPQLTMGSVRGTEASRQSADRDAQDNGKPHLQPMMRETQARLPPPWRSALRGVDDLFWRCTSLTCDAAHRYLQALRLTSSAAHPDSREGSRGAVMGHTKSRMRPMATNASLASTTGADDEGENLLVELANPSSSIAWESLQRSLNVLNILMHECGQAILSEPSPCTSESGLASAEADAGKDGNHMQPQEPDSQQPFCLGGHGLHVLCSFIFGPLFIMVPTVLLMASRLAKNADGGKAAPSAKRALQLPAWPRIEASRTALRLLCEEMVNVLRQLLQAVQHSDSDTYDHLGGGGPEGPRHSKHDEGSKSPSVARCEFFVHQRSFGPHTMDLARLQKLVSNTVTTSHRRQLKALSEHLQGRIDLLKGLAIRLTTL